MGRTVIRLTNAHALDTYSTVIFFESSIAAVIFIIMAIAVRKKGWTPLAYILVILVFLNILRALFAVGFHRMFQP